MIDDFVSVKVGDSREHDDCNKDEVDFPRSRIVGFIRSNNDSSSNEESYFISFMRCENVVLLTSKVSCCCDQCQPSNDAEPPHSKRRDSLPSLTA